MSNLVLSRSNLIKMRSVSNFFQSLRKTKDPGPDVMQTSLRRCLNTFDITLLGIGNVMGSGIYVLTPSLASRTTGPAIIISYLIAGVASFLAALAYAEFGVRFPRAGSAYSYAYYSVGEFMAFFVGWNVVLEQMISVSAVARSCSAYIDSLTHGYINASIASAVGSLPGPYLSSQPDFLALGIIVLFMIFMSFGANITSWLNNVLCCVNIFTLLIAFGTGVYFADMKNWTDEKTGGFFPYGAGGVLQASASCFFAYVGFDAIATSGEEAKDPQKSLPRATFMAMSVVMVLYIAVSAVLTLMVNYTMINPASGFPDAFENLGAEWAKYVVVVGGLSAMTAVVLATLYSLTRIAYAMADDGLINTIFSKVHKRTQLPLIAMYAFGSISAILAVILDIDVLVEMLSIGTLFAYLVVCAGVIIFRYERPHDKISCSSSSDSLPHLKTIYQPESKLKPEFRCLEPLFQKFRTDRLVLFCLGFTVLLTYALGFTFKTKSEEIFQGSWWLILIVCLLAVAIITCFCIIVIHREIECKGMAYKMPWVPFLPFASIVVNAALMTTLEPLTWMRLVIWLALGFTYYFLYGFRHSKVNRASLFSTKL